MLLKRIVVATLFSLPLLPFLLLPVGTLDDFVEMRDMLWAAPFILEFMGFYAIYSFTKYRGSFSASEQRLLAVMAVGFFVIFGLPLLIMQLIHPEPGISTLGFTIMLGYALVGLVINTKKVAGSRTHIKTYFAKRYVLPGVASLIVMFAALLITNTELNAFALYLVIKSYLFALSKD